MKEMTERLAADAELAAAYAAAHEDYLARRAQLGAGARDRRASRPAACRPASSACTCSSATRSPPGRASTRSATRRSRCSPTGGPTGRASPDAAGARGRDARRDRRLDPRRRRRLRHQLDPPARRRRRPRRPARSTTSCAGWRSSGSARASTAPAGIAPEALERTLAAAGEYAAQCRELGRRRVRFVATSASRDADNADEFVAGVRDAFAALGTAPRSSPATRRRRSPSAAPPATSRGAASPAPTSSSTSAAARPSSCAGHRRRSRRPRSVDIGCVRMTERHLHSDPPVARRSSPRPSATSTRPLDLAAERVAARGRRDAGRPRRQRHHRDRARPAT